MKNYSLVFMISIALYLFSNTQLNAQIEKGTFSLGNNIGFSLLNVQDSDFRSSSFSLTAIPGYYIINNLAIELNVGASTTRFASFNGSSRSSSFTFGGGVKYMVQLKERLYLPVSVGVNLETSVSNDNNSPSTSNVNNSIVLGSGLEYLVNNKLSVRYTVQFLRRNFESNISTNNLNGFVGVFFYFTRNKK